PVRYSWRAGGSEAGGTGGFYDLLGPNNYNVEDGSFAKIREVNVSYNFGRIRGIGDVTLGVVGRNLYTFTNYSGYDPETGATAGNNNTVGLTNTNAAHDFPHIS